MKATDETWVWDGFDDITAGEGEGAFVVALVGAGPSANPARAHLAAAAPALYRALLSVEWCNGDGRCPDCGWNKGETHSKYCALADTLKKARGE